MNEQDQSIWDQYRRGGSARAIGRSLGVSHRLVQRRLNKCGGIKPAERRRGVGRLSFDDREEISRGIAAGLSANSTASQMERPPSTISREIARNGGRDAYRAVDAEQAAWDRALRPKPNKLAGDALLRSDVVEGLANKWSPEQIAGRLEHRRAPPHEPLIEGAENNVGIVRLSPIRIQQWSSVLRPSRA